MKVEPEAIEAFAPVSWAAPILTSPEWVFCDRTRGATPGEDVDRFCDEIMRAPGAIECWLEGYKKPEPGSTSPTKALSFCKFGTGLSGFYSICHGGSIMTMMDEALGAAMLNIVVEGRHDANKKTAERWKQLVKEKRPWREVLQGAYVTAKLDIKFLRPVLCPGMVGIEVDLLEHVGPKMKIRGVMRDETGAPLLQADSIWVRMGAGAKL